ncbi:hypothetical protein KIV66_gp45 [Mycobacterium phage MyraDee]|uniref:Acb2/Tad1 hairpin domain-containing protein n=1 Tax=Mycobacterium phage MyraDee TaxID=2024303 RepID=A0A222YZ09_9CAUD|nr:hypothetical protein KIV66_gp45 [Mycobacterium phage MyraDee]ASR77153.1 hypothetical protein SEA_MYRADEE_45 [Mycobacterium phage MyraDee]
MYDTERAYRFYSDSILADEVKDEFKELADYLVAVLPEGREKALALTQLEQTWHWADTAIGDK